MLMQRGGAMSEREQTAGVQLYSDSGSWHADPSARPSSGGAQTGQSSSTDLTCTRDDLGTFPLILA